MTDSSVQELDAWGEPQEAPEVLQLRELRHWLAQSSWSGQPDPGSNLPWADIVCILAGLKLAPGASDWDIGHEAHRAEWVEFLPDGQKFYVGTSDRLRDRADFENLALGIESQVAALKGLRLATMRPQDAIRHVLAAGVKIPWLEAARRDPECHAFLPPEALYETQVTGTGGTHSKRDETARSKAKKRWHEDERVKLVEGIGRAKFQELARENFKRHRWPEAEGKRSGTIYKAKVARAILKHIEEKTKDDPTGPLIQERMVRDHVNAWLHEYRELYGQDSQSSRWA